MHEFVLNPQLEADTEWVIDLPLCRVLLMNDQQYPWLILVPRVKKTGADGQQQVIKEVYQLSAEQQAELWSECTAVGKYMMQELQGDKLNIATLGNMVPQLHVHVIVRFKNDAAWPAPVWGQHPAKPYTEADKQARLASLRKGLSTD